MNRNMNVLRNQNKSRKCSKVESNVYDREDLRLKDFKRLTRINTY